MGALVRLLQEAPPVRAATGCSLNGESVIPPCSGAVIAHAITFLSSDALRELERYRASSRGSSG